MDDTPRALDQRENYVTLVGPELTRIVRCDQSVHAIDAEPAFGRRQRQIFGYGARFLARARQTRINVRWIRLWLADDERPRIHARVVHARPKLGRPELPQQLDANGPRRFAPSAGVRVEQFPGNRRRALIKLQLQ